MTGFNPDRSMDELWGDISPPNQDNKPDQLKIPRTIMAQEFVVRWPDDDEENIGINAQTDIEGEQ